jgi:hypothetical protein
MAQLAEAYKPVLWMPDKVASTERAWQIYASQKPGKQRSDETLKEAVQECNGDAIVVRELCPTWCHRLLYSLSPCVPNVCLG